MHHRSCISINQQNIFQMAAGSIRIPPLSHINIITNAHGHNSKPVEIGGVVEKSLFGAVDAKFAVLFGRYLRDRQHKSPGSIIVFR
jgi:hypothetical protein